MAKKSGFLKSVGYAVAGIKYCILKEKHMRVHLGAGFGAIFLGWFLHISLIKWAVLALTITLVLVLEMINTAIEKTLDLITPEYHPYAEVAKNVAAGAVLVAALNALIIGAVIFLI